MRDVQETQISAEFLIQNVLVIVCLESTLSRIVQLISLPLLFVFPPCSDVKDFTAVAVGGLGYCPQHKRAHWQCVEGV
jgi:hypothetical protein